MKKTKSKKTIHNGLTQLERAQLAEVFGGTTDDPNNPIPAAGTSDYYWASSSGGGYNSYDTVPGSPNASDDSGVFINPSIGDLLNTTGDLLDPSTGKAPGPVRMGPREDILGETGANIHASREARGRGASHWETLCVSASSREFHTSHEINVIM